MALIFGIESTCDETSCSVVKDGKIILSNIISSQAEIHSTYGGVVPEIACRKHLEVITDVAQEALNKAHCSWNDIDAIAVAKGPGLIGALLIGLNYAKGLSLGLNKPLIGVNHVEAHLYAAIMSTSNDVAFPALGVIISGGHTCLLKIQAIGSYELISNTVDDAVGECFDKVGSLIGLEYPAGPRLEKLAQNGNPYHYALKAGQVKGQPLHFSFSGLKTSVLYTINGQNNPNSSSTLSLSDQDKAHLAASFQQAALGDIVKKTEMASKSFPFRSICLGGGVSQNLYLRQLFEKSQIKLPLFWPSKELCLDNAAMIAGLGYHYWKQNPQGDGLDLQPSARIPIGNST